MEKGFHPDLLIAEKLAYEPCGLMTQGVVKEAESEEYGALAFELNGKRVKFRVGRVTPTKIGQFVTLWKRVGDGPIQPFDHADPVDYFIISVCNSDHFGQFVFPKAVLCERGYVSKEGKGGKRAIRIYPPWDVAVNQQAVKSQAWQLLYFFEILPNKATDLARVQKLFL